MSRAPSVAKINRRRIGHKEFGTLDQSPSPSSTNLTEKTKRFSKKVDWVLHSYNGQKHPSGYPAYSELNP